MSERLLRVIAPHFVAGVVFERQAHGWVITRMAPILRKPLAGLPIKDIRAYLVRRGWAWEWVQ